MASGARRFRARDAIIAILVAALILVLIQGASIRRAGDQLNPGPGRDVVLAVGKPASWVRRPGCRCTPSRRSSRAGCPPTPS